MSYSPKKHYLKNVPVIQIFAYTEITFLSINWKLAKKKLMAKYLTPPISTFHLTLKKEGSDSWNTVHISLIDDKNLNHVRIGSWKSEDLAI